MKPKSDKFKISLETQVIHDLLIDLEVGDIVEYKELNTLINGDVQNGQRHHLMSAREMAQRDENVVFATIIDVGIKRMSDGEIAQSGDYSRKHIHRTADKALDRLACIDDFDKLPNELKIEHNTSMAIMGVLREATKTKTVKQIRGSIENPKKELPSAFIMETIKHIVRG
jgi:hypothetical protein